MYNNVYCIRNRKKIKKKKTLTKKIVNHSAEIRLVCFHNLLWYKLNTKESSNLTVMCFVQVFFV